MKTKFLFLTTVIFLVLSMNKAKAQYCFWVANQSFTTFYDVKLRAHGTGNAFRDLLPSDYLRRGEHCWVITSSSTEMYDVQITKMDGTVILFTYKDVNGDWHISQRYISVNARRLHTLVIGENSSGELNFSYYTTDELDFGHPCY